MENMICDVAVIGSGAGGGVIAHRLTEMGFKVVLLEAGDHVRTESFTTHAWQTLKNIYWNHGFQFSPGPPTIPFLQGRVVGGSTVINSAIIWDLPEKILSDWASAEDLGISYDEITAEQRRLRQDLHVVQVDPILDGHNNIMRLGAERLGWAGRRTYRNEKGCRGSGRCLLGCPNGAKMSLQLSYIPWALEKGLRLITKCEAERILIEKNHVSGILVRQCSNNGESQRFIVRAKLVVVSAGVIQSPLILQRSKIPDPNALIGSNLMSHPGVSMVGLFDERVNIWSGATQGYEVTQFNSEGMKLESLAITPAHFAYRLPGAGVRLAELYERRAHMVLWLLTIKGKTLGSVKQGRYLSPIRYSLVDADVAGIIHGIRVLGELMFAAGAREVYPGLARRPKVVTSLEELYAATKPTVTADCLHPVATHLFGTCRISGNPHRGVVNNNFESNRVKGLFVADGSVLPTNIGVNPQLTIMTLASIAAKRMATIL